MSGPIRLPESWVNRPKKAGTVSAEKRLCDLLALPHPDELPDGGPAFHVGSVAPASSVELVEKITGEWLAEKRAIIARQIAAGEWDGATGADFPGTPWADKDYPLDEGQLSKALAFSVLFLTFRQFLQNVTKGPRPVEVTRMSTQGWIGGGAQASSRREHFKPEDQRFMTLRGGSRGEARPDWTPNLAGYLAYLREVAPGMAAFLSRPLPVMLPAAAMLRHTYATGAIGSGKTEMLKLLIHGLAGVGNCAVVVLDPHGDMAEQIARWPEFAPGGAWHGRLAYVDPFLDDGHSPCLNPFDLGVGRCMVTGSITQHFEDDTLMDAYFAFGDRDLSLTFQDTPGNTMLVEIPNMKYVGTAQIDKPGPDSDVLVTMDFQAYADIGADALIRFTRTAA